MPLIIQIILIGFIVGFVARLLYPGPNTPRGFVLTAVLGFVGAYLATSIGRAVGWLDSNQLAGPIGMVIGAVIVLFVWDRLVAYGVVRDPGAPATPPNRQKT